MQKGFKKAYLLEIAHPVINKHCIDGGVAWNTFSGSVFKTGEVVTQIVLTTQTTNIVRVQISL